MMPRALYAGLLAALLHAAPTFAERLPTAHPGDTDSLRQAMAEVGPDDSRTIRLDGGTYEFRDSTATHDDFRCENTLMPMVVGHISLVGAGSTLAGVDGGALPFCIKENGSMALRDLTVSGFSRGESPYLATFLSNEGSVTIEDLSFHDNHSNTGTLIFNDDTGRIEINRSQFVDNAGGEAIIRNNGLLAVRNAAFVGNELDGMGGFSASRPSAIYVARRARVDLLNTTLANNTSGLFAIASDVAVTQSTITGNGHGVTAPGGVVYLRNSIVAENPGADCDFGAGATVLREGVNLDGDGTCGLDPDRDLVATDPRLHPLPSMDGSLPGREPDSDSPVLDRGDPRFCPFRDAAGRIRGTANDPRCALGALERPNEPPDFRIDARLTGTWYDPEHDGHYVSFQVLPIDLVAVTWWTYGPDGEPLWLIGSGRVKGNTATIDVYASRGMTLPTLDDAARQEDRWGTLELRFRDCSELQLRWQTNQPGFGNGAATMTRLTTIEDLAC